MSTFTRNTRRANCARCPRAVAAGLALMLASGAALADGAHQFVFTAYSDAVGGADVVAGRYRAALEELNGNPNITDLDPSATNTNRCVAYSMTLPWQEAHAACDAAVRAASEQRLARAGELSWRTPSEADRLAVAYTNRAVMHWLAHDDAAARGDLAKALQLSPQAAFVARNVTALKVHAEVAEAGASASKS
jgi:hypothetical protein